MGYVIIGRLRGVKVVAINETVKKQFLAFRAGALENNNYWALQAYKNVLSLNSGYSKPNVFAPKLEKHVDGRPVFKMLMPGCEASMRHEENGDLLILKMESSDAYARLQTNEQKPGYFEVDSNSVPWPKQRVSKTKFPVVVCDRHRTLKEAVTMAGLYAKKVPDITLQDGFGVFYTPDESPLAGYECIQKAQRSMKTDVDSALKESAEVLYGLMQNAKNQQFITWIPQWGGSGIMDQTLRKFSGNTSEFKTNEHKLFLVAPTTDANELEELAIKNGIKVDPNSRYYDAFNMTQLIGSGRLKGGTFVAAWRRMRRNTDGEYNAAKFASDSSKELVKGWGVHGHATAVGSLLARLGVVGTGASTAAMATDAPALIGLGLALYGAGDVAFQSFFPKQYHKVKDKIS